MKLSVVIPTHNRADILQTCLEHLENQTVVNDMEVIVVSDDGTGEVQPESGGKWDMDIRFENVEPCQQGVARNHGTKLATAPITLFIGDDIFLAPDACEKHIVAHREKCAVLGFTTWDPDVGITPVMQWLEQSGWQFGYPKIAQYAHGQIPTDLQHKFTYTSNISLPTDVAKAHPFRDDVSLYGWEDIEWGMRLRDAGIPLVYEPDAKALHHHHITKEQSLKRMETLGTSVVHLAKQEPNLDRLPTGLKRLAYEGAAMLPTMAGQHRKAFLRGIRKGNT